MKAYFCSSPGQFPLTPPPYYWHAKQCRASSQHVLPAKEESCSILCHLCGEPFASFIGLCVLPPQGCISPGNGPWTVAYRSFNPSPLRWVEQEGTGSKRVALGSAGPTGGRVVAFLFSLGQEEEARRQDGQDSDRGYVRLESVGAGFWWQPGKDFKK